MPGIADRSRPVPEGASRSRPGSALLEDRYEAYRAREAANLLSLLPREGIRPVYRAAREWATSRGVHDPDDPMATLLLYCRDQLLPLPPFEVWVEDLRTHPEPHAAGASAGPGWGGGSERLLESRRLEGRGGSWRVCLHVGPSPTGWKGWIRFSREEGSRSTRTAEIFREADPDSIRERFLSFGPETLRAFLRSTLP